MANTEYLLPDGGFYNDTEQGKEILLPGGGFINEQAAAAEPPVATSGAITKLIMFNNLGTNLFDGTIITH